MSVASHIESEHGAVVTDKFPLIVGTIHTAIGCGTLRRLDSDAAIQVRVGDPVHSGDEIETAAEGQIGIRFVDGTLFMLSSGSRLVLNEFVLAPHGISHSALFAVARGAFAFLPGQVAQTGSLLIDTPIGRIRSRVGGFGTLSLAALTFTAMGDVQAADPDATFLDHDEITYRDLPHGVVELWTKGEVSRHVIVDDPGKTFVLTKSGSSVSVNQAANSAARMEELRAAQQAVLANFAKGYGPKGSSTPDDSKLPAFQPINYTQPDFSTPPGQLPPLPSAIDQVYEAPFIKPPPPPPPPPTLNAATGPLLIDTSVFDTFTASGGSFVADSPRQDATLVYGISGGTFGATVLDGVTYDVSRTGLYGTLYLNSASGAYVYVPDSDAINALKSPANENFAITVSDGTLSASQTYAIIINGTNDAAAISGAATGSVIEIRGVINATPGTQTAAGVLTDTDPDDPPNTFTAISSPTQSTGGYGTFTMTAAGVWTYTLDNNNSTVKTLNVGATLIDTFPVTSIDGTPQVVTITIHGPLIATAGTGPLLTLSETHLTATSLNDNIAGSAPNAALTTISGDYSTAFTSVQGIDGATISYALSITGGDGTASGLIDSHSGLADVLVLNGNTIEGHVGTSDGTLAFTITVDPNTGLVAFTEYRPVSQVLASSPDSGEAAILTAGIVNLTATVTDKEGVFQTASLDLGGRLTITDDGAMIAATGTAPSLTLSETHLTATALNDNIAGSAPNVALTTITGDFSTAFASVQGADGATVSYALSITGGDGTASGLTDSHSGFADVLVLNGDTIEGHVGTTDGTLAFTITVDPNTGVVTFTEYRAVSQALATNPDTGEGGSLTSGIVNLIATTVDADGDFQTSRLDLGKQLTLTDDGPTIGSFDPAIVVAQDHETANGGYDINFGGDGAAALLVAVHDGAVGSTGYDLATTDLGDGITSVHVTGNGTDYTFYYTTQAVDGGVKLNAFFNYTSGTLSDPFFALLINPDETYTFDIEAVGFLKQTTVSGSDFGASSSGQPSLTAPDGLLVITGDFNGTLAHVKASNNGIAVGDSGLQMDQQETLLLTFKPEQANVSFMLTQWQGNGTASVILTIYDGETAIHVFAIDVAKPSGDAQIVVKQTSDLALVNTYIFDGATSTYTLYVGSEFNQVGISYDHAAAGNTTFTVNDITYDAGTTIPSTDLLFDVTAVDNDGDTSTTGLQIDLLGGTNLASAPTLDNASGDQLVGGTSSDILIDSFGATSADSSFTVVSPPRPSTGGYGTFAMTVAGLWTYMLEHAHATVQALDGTMQLETVVIAGASDAAITSTITAGSVIEAGGTPVATGTLSDLDVNKAANPPSVDGTPQDEKIAGGCDDAPSVHARTEGPANDTANGQGENNDGTVAIHDGSASHIINNANDTVFGGYGGDRLTRSNGDDSIYQTAADSNSAKFETILDFAAGLGRTNLAAFGALAFMALSPTSTSVPPHTLAWIYDSAANRTIVYVNPTDQTLHIGDSDLLEIHLEGVTSVQAPDFVHEAAAVTAAATLETIDPALAMIVAGDGSVLSVSSDVSIDVTDSEGTHAANGIWASTADEGLNFHFARERIDSTESARLSNLDRARAYEAADGDGDSITAHVGISVEIHAHATAQTTPSEDHFAFAQGPVHANSNAMAIADATDMHPGATIDHGGFMVANATAGAQHVGAGKTQGDNASQSQQELRPASEHATAPAQSHAKQAPAGEAVGHAEKADPPGLGDSFKFAKFTDKMAGSEHSNAFDPPEVAHALDAHGRDNAKPADPSSESDLGGLSQAEQHAHDYAAAAHLPAAASAHHLIL